MYLLYFLYNLFSAGRWGRISFCNHTPSLLEATSTKVKTICKISCSPFFSFLFFFFFANAFLCHFTSAWMCQQSSWHGNLSVVCRPSFRRPCRDYLRVYWVDFFQFQLLLALGHMPRHFCFQFWKKKCFPIFHDFFFIFVNMVLRSP